MDKEQIESILNNPEDMEAFSNALKRKKDFLDKFSEFIQKYHKENNIDSIEMINMVFIFNLTGILSALDIKDEKLKNKYICMLKDKIEPFIKKVDKEEWNKYEKMKSNLNKLRN